METKTNTLDVPPSATPARRALWKTVARRVAVVVVLAMTAAWLLNRSALHDPEAPAGFWRGMVHGATMPLAMPNLLFGIDLAIYAPENTGRTYKLGYTVGVNGCGALFFGYLYWRVSRWRRRGDRTD